MHMKTKSMGIAKKNAKCVTKWLCLGLMKQVKHIL